MCLSKRSIAVRTITGIPSIPLSYQRRKYDKRDVADCPTGFLGWLDLWCGLGRNCLSIGRTRADSLTWISIFADGCRPASQRHAARIELLSFAWRHSELVQRT